MNLLWEDKGNVKSQVFVFQITELLTDVERLKKALNGLSQLAYTSSSPNKRQTQHADTLQAQINSLQQQLAVSSEQTPHAVCKIHISQNGADSA